MSTKNQRSRSKERFWRQMMRQWRRSGLSLRAFYVACHQRRRRPGKTFAGFEQALAHLPTRVLRATAAGLRRRLAQVLADRWESNGDSLLKF